MVFNTTNLFKGIACPGGDACRLTNCIFAHDAASTKDERIKVQSRSLGHDSIKDIGEEQSTDGTHPPPTKRRKVMDLSDPTSKEQSSKAELMRESGTIKRQSKDDIRSFPAINKVIASTAPRDAGQTPNIVNRALSTLSRSVSPPSITKGTNNGHQNPLQGLEMPSETIAESKNAGTAAGTAAGTFLSSSQGSGAEKLNPRLIPNDPVGHSKRSLYLKHLHAEMVRLNQQMIDGGVGKKQSRKLNEQELILLAINEEERIARDQPKVYPNRIKNRIALYKKMTLEAWTKTVQDALGSPADSKVKGEKSSGKISTGLTTEEENVILRHLIADQKPLSQFGYIPKPPTAEQAAEAASAVEASKNYEQCDRCGARFQVFPDRNESGALTTNGPCRHHPNKKAFPQRSKSDHYTGPKEPYYPCCNALVGSIGCTTLDDHAFKTSNPARLAATLPFVQTPDNANPRPDSHGNKVAALTFDCEMGYTVLGLELIRLTAISWPQGESLIDVLVRPLGAIIDLNSRFSGVWPEHYVNAIPYDEWKSHHSATHLSSNVEGASEPMSRRHLPLVSSPQQARDLLCSFLTPDTPLLGHAIDNDLNAVRLCHPSIVDTVLLFPHPRGLPMRLGLKALSARHLARNIQVSGAEGHDSFEDAEATGELVRVKVRDTWRLLQARGWKIRDGNLIHPTETTIDSGGITKGGFPLKDKGVVAGRKREREPADDGSIEAEPEENRKPLGVAAYLQRDELK